MKGLHYFLIFTGSWSQYYIRYYYQKEESRLCACNLPTHGLLHIPDDFRNCGPLCNTWTFFNERFIGRLQSGIKSRVHPWGNLSQRCYKLAILAQLGSIYSLEDELSTGPTPGELSRTETVYDECGIYLSTWDYYLKFTWTLDLGTILRSPRNGNYKPVEEVRHKIAEYLKTIIGGNSKTIQNQLPETMTSWAKVRIKDGDFIRSKASLTRMNRSRDNSYIRVGHFHFIDFKFG